MDNQATSTTPEQQQLVFLLAKCRGEGETEKLYNHLQALKTYLLVYLIQKNTLTYQIQNGTVVEGNLEDHLVENCTRCVGECKKIMRSLHKLLRMYEKGGTNSVSFRDEATHLIGKLEQNIHRFNELLGE
ncbi:MAG: hypothetical protein HQL72_03460 [Magnetococcales bacterium]|nr:hypothetical protein [Magnetococcales bacterium]